LLNNADLKVQFANPFGNTLIPDLNAVESIQLSNGVFYYYTTTNSYDEDLNTFCPEVIWKSIDYENWYLRIEFILKT
jgi:hypothetical protein